MEQTTTSRKIMRSRAAGRAALRGSEDSKKRLDKLLQSIAALEDQQQEIALQRLQLEQEVEQTLKAGGMTEYEWGPLVAHIVDVYSKASREVDPQVLYNKLKERDFFACVKVSMTELGKIMAPKEIEKIGKLTPARKTGTKFEIIRPKKKVSK